MSDTTTFEDLVKQMTDLQSICKNLYQFTLHPEIKENWLTASELFVNGEDTESEAIELGSRAIRRASGTLAKFFSNSASHYGRKVDERDVDGWKDYADEDEDILQGLRNKLADLVEAIRTETGFTCFDQRSQAHMAMGKALLGADSAVRRRIKEEQRLEAEELARQASEARKQLGERARTLFD